MTTEMNSSATCFNPVWSALRSNAPATPVDEFWDNKTPTPQGLPNSITLDSNEIMRRAFSLKATAKYNESWIIYQTLFADSPGRFELISPLHQNTKEDRLHISVSLITLHFRATFHIYGYIKNHFIVTDITRSTRDGVMTVAEFEQWPSK
jgi:hypothetical protein